VIGEAQAQHFAEDWVASWNAHDLERILSHYTADFSMTSPLIVQIAGEASGTLKGHAAVGAYWRKALERIPDLRFELLGIFRSVDSVVLHYRNQAGRLSAESFRFNADGKVHTAVAHYA
jgi:hypothetical protein